MSPSDTRTGLAYGLGAYALWGLFPLYFVLLTGSGALEVVAHRALWTLAFCLLLLAITRGFPELVNVWRTPRLLIGLAVAGILIAANWTLYVLGVTTGRTLDTALGYFINPLAVTALGVLVLRERLRPGQWAAVGVGALAVLVLVIGYGQIPWIALGLAASFGTYSLVKKVVGRSVPPIPGLATETAAIVPIAIAYLGYLSLTNTATVDLLSGYGALVAISGVITAIPLLLFAAAARRLSMVTIGIIQYLAPIGQFVVGWLVFHEPMPASRWAGFILVWLAVGIFLADAVLAQRRRAR